MFLLITALFNIYHYFPDTFVLSMNYPKEIESEVTKMYNTRNYALLNGDIKALIGLFDTNQKYGQWAMEHEVKRVKYLKDWAKERGIKFINIESKIRIKRIYEVKDKIKLSIDELSRFDYIYSDDENSHINSFGIGLKHYLTLIKDKGKYVIYNDWYTDCFQDAMQRYSGEINDYEDIQSSTQTETLTEAIEYKVSYNRKKAVEYADKYCGAAWGSDNEFKYNKKYSDYNGLGGDCTNFVSQVIGDEEGGGLLKDKIWFCSSSKGGRCFGSKAWVNAGAFKDYIIYSGKGRIIKKGTYKDLTKPIEGYKGAIYKLEAGDLICYEKKGKADHFAVITSFDSHGYPLVNSHTTDRYHVPWDLGWGDKDVKFILIHING
ncbi:hypothetical protein FDN13_06565 [Caloramator sp. E03]|nr:hypothetical protein FDN13_06565 [Caloramator sp. E03]